MTQAASEGANMIDACVTCIRHPPKPKAAPPFHCDLCGHHIGNYVTVLDNDKAYCLRCLGDMRGTRRHHPAVFPNCPVEWHDLHDHVKAHGTRAGVAAFLGIWPKKAS